MPSDRNPQSESELESVLRENAALKRNMEWLSRQLYGRVMPGLFAAPSMAHGNPARNGGPAGDHDPAPSALRESAATYHVHAPTDIPPDLPSDEKVLELPPAQAAGLSVAGYESSEAVAARSAFTRRTIRRAMYVSNDGSGMAVAAPAPALFPDPDGGPLAFDASFVAHVAFLRMAGMSFRTISELMETESGLAVSEPALRALALAAAETVMPLCAAMIARTLPDWGNLRRMFEEAKSGGDWLADGFLKTIHALEELENHARIRAGRLGGSPEDLYRERRAARTESARIAAAFFEQCRETLPAQNPQSPLAGTLRYAIEHERTLSVFLHDPRIELSCANPGTPVAEPFAALAACADECRMHGVSFRAWLEDTLIKLKQPEPPPFESLLPHRTAGAERRNR
jgi:hypothetical protein